MKTGLRIFGIILLALFTISMSECDQSGDYNSGSYFLFAIDDSVLVPDDGITGSLTLESNGNWVSNIVFTSPYGIIRLSGTRRDSSYLYAKIGSIDGVDFSIDDSIRYTSAEETIRYIYADTDYVWVNVNADLDSKIRLPPSL